MEKKFIKFIEVSNIILLDVETVVDTFLNSTFLDKDYFDNLLSPKF